MIDRRNHTTARCPVTRRGRGGGKEDTMQVTFCLAPPPHAVHRQHHPLRRRNPHDIVQYLELQHAQSMGHVVAALPSPRVLATHLPCSLLPRRMTAEESGCRIMYLCRDTKDAFGSLWLFA